MDNNNNDDGAVAAEADAAAVAAADEGREAWLSEVLSAVEERSSITLDGPTKQNLGLIAAGYARGDHASVDTSSAVGYLLREVLPSLLASQGADNDAGSKRKAEDALHQVKPRRKFFLTFKGDDEDPTIGTSLEFEKEPSAGELRDRLKKECQLSALLPLFYYSSSNFYTKVPKKGPLPEDMNVLLESTGEIHIVLARSTPPASPDLKEQTHRTSVESLDVESLAERLNQAMNSKPPHIRLELYDEAFMGIPLLFADNVYRGLIENLRRPRGEAEDSEVIVLFAVPGAGKSRTIRESCTLTAGPNFKRIKMNDGELLRCFNVIAKQKKGELRKQMYSYEDVKEWMLPAAQKYWSLLIERNPGVKVLHFDEVQVMMGHHKVSSKNFRELRDKLELRDFFMPVFCQAIENGTSLVESPRVIMSGTNFFSPLQFNPGSSLKVQDRLHLQGRFPHRWVMEKLISKYFDLEVLKKTPHCMATFERIIEHVSANRRVVQYFLSELRDYLLGVLSVLDADKLVEEAQKCSSRALDSWTRTCGENTGANCMMALGLCLHPEGYGGVKGEMDSQFPQEYHNECPNIEVVVIKRSKLPEAVRLYADAGGLNIWRKDEEYDAVEVPVGCLREYLLRKCRNLNPRANVADIDAIKIYGNKVDPNAKGHLFERLLAYELTTFGSGIGSLVCKTLSVKGRKMVLDGRIFGREWVSVPTIIEQWQDGRVHCVFEDATCRGRKIVDVGFPIINVSSRQKEDWRVFCELKCGYQPGDLWKLCLEFLKKIKPILESYPESCAIFIASKLFLENRLKEGAETSRAKKTVMEDEMYRDRFFIFDGESLEDQSILSLQNLDHKMPIDVSSCTARVEEGDYYVSESQVEEKHMEL